jgi:putative tryptophan/tyrosine transport system substrate-binding protein
MKLTAMLRGLRLHRVVGLMLTAILSISVVSFSGHAQTSKRLARVGYLAANVAPAAPSFEAFRQGLQELGWIEGQNIALE